MAGLSLPLSGWLAGWLQGEMFSMRAGVLAAEIDITQLLLEAADLAEQGLITGQELATMKAKWLALL